MSLIAKQEAERNRLKRISHHWPDVDDFAEIISNGHRSHAGKGNEHTPAAPDARLPPL